MTKYKRILVVAAWLLSLAALLAFILNKPQRVDILIHMPATLFLSLSGLILLTWITIYLEPAQKV